MLFIMCIGLYTVRAILHILGEVDYGIYNVVGSFVAMFSFVNSSLATASQRYFSIELVNKDKEALNKQFCLNITLFILIVVIVVILLETLGLWFVNSSLTIPYERLRTANYVYQLSILAFSFQLLSVPYNGMVIAYEKMSAFAYIGIVEALFKLLVVFVLSNISWDKLVIYSVFMCLSSAGVTISYIIYCRRNLEGCIFHFYWDWGKVKSLFKFTGWHLLGTTSVVVRSQAINLLINMFFNPAVNAARAVAFQVSGAVSQLSSNFFVAVKPQMYKSCANREFDALQRLILRSSMISVFLVSVLAIPFILCANYILGFWLLEVPEYTEMFTKLVLLNSIIDATSDSIICPVLATGKIKKFYLITSTLLILNFPVSYFFLKIGYEPQVTMIISIVVSVLLVFFRVALLSELIPFGVYDYIVLMLKLAFISSFVYFFLYVLFHDVEMNIVVLMIIFSLSTISHIFLYAFCLPRGDVKKIVYLLRNKIFNDVKEKCFHNRKK